MKLYCNDGRILVSHVSSADTSYELTYNIIKDIERFMIEQYFDENLIKISNRRSRNEEIYMQCSVDLLDNNRLKFLKLVTPIGTFKMTPEDEQDIYREIVVEVLTKKQGQGHFNYTDDDDEEEVWEFSDSDVEPEPETFSFRLRDL